MPEIHNIPTSPNIRLATINRVEAFDDMISPEHREYLQIEKERQKIYDNSIRTGLQPNKYAPMTYHDGKVRPSREVVADLYLLVGETPESKHEILYELYGDYAKTAAIEDIATEVVRPGITKMQIQNELFNEPYLRKHDFETLFVTSDRFLPGEKLPEDTPPGELNPNKLKELAPTLRKFTQDFNYILQGFGIEQNNFVARTLRREACADIIGYNQLPYHDVGTEAALEQLHIDPNDYKALLKTLHDAYKRPENQLNS